MVPPECALDPFEKRLSTAIRKVVSIAHDNHELARLQGSVVPISLVRYNGLIWHGNLVGVDHDISSISNQNHYSKDAKNQSEVNSQLMPEQKQATEKRAKQSLTKIGEDNHILREMYQEQMASCPTMGCSTSRKKYASFFLKKVAPSNEYSKTKDYQLLRLSIGCEAIARIRRLIFMELGLTCCAGVAQNKVTTSSMSFSNTNKNTSSHFHCWLLLKLRGNYINRTSKHACYPMLLSTC